MELELGLKITQTRDDISSMADVRIAKDGGGIVFLSREIESKFILTAHLKGYRREQIDIKINEDGTRITISANKAVQEKVMQGWILHKKEVELRGFKKTFKIPGGVVLDKITAKFDEDGAILTVLMPKMVQGVSRHVIEEVEELEDDRGRIEEEHKDNATKEMKGVEEDKEGGVNGRELQAQVAADDVPKAQIRERQPESMPAISNQQMAFDHEKQNSRVIEEPQTKEATRECELPHTSSASQQLPAEGPVPRPLQEEGTKVEAQLTKPEDDQQPGKVESKPKKRKKIKICAPCVAGSALLVSLIVLAIHLIRAKR